MIVQEVAEKSLACGKDSVMSAGSSPAAGDVSGSDSISPVQGARVILKTEIRRSMWRTTLATAGFLFLNKERQRVETRVVSLRSVTRCVSSQNAPCSCTRSNTIRVRWGQVSSRSLGTGVCTSSLPLPVASVWGRGGGGLPLQVAPCCAHPCGGWSAPCPAGGETSARGAGLGAELSWRLMAARPQG